MAYRKEENLASNISCASEGNSADKSMLSFKRKQLEIDEENNE